MRPERLWWCLPAIVLCATDGLLTLWGQPQAYWSGNFASINEDHPVAAWFLSLHPLAFAAAGVGLADHRSPRGSHVGAT